MPTSTDDLTDRQRDTLRLHREGKSPTEIAAELGISSQGVHGHFRRLRAKGLMEAEDQAPRRAASRRPRNGRFNADTALDVVRRAASEQRTLIATRKQTIAEEIATLKAEDKMLTETQKKIDAMVGEQVPA